MSNNPRADAQDPSQAAGEAESSPPPVQDDPHVWSFRGYQLRPGDFTTAMVHLFRAEVNRANVWRQRLDTTTNWAIITTGAVITIAFGASPASHMVVLLDLLLVTIFLFIEARRYRYYELWSYRVRLMETDFFAGMLVPPFHPASDWAELLAESLLHPRFPISMWEALGRRLRRNYLAIYAIILMAWFTKLLFQPTMATSLGDLVLRASVGPLPGQLIVGALLVSAIVVLLFGFLSAGLQDAPGEILPRFTGVAETILSGTSHTAQDKDNTHPWYRHSRRRQQYLTYIITDQTQPVTQRILEDMQRGVTALSGTGMYTGKAHSVLMIALTTTEIPQLKELVRKADPNAFIIVSPAQEVFGRGFVPL